MRKKLAVVGFSESSRDLAPYDSEEFDIWGCNHIYQFVPRLDALFELHSSEFLEVRYEDHWPEYRKYLQTTNVPIYMADQYEEYPASIRFPLEEMKERFGFWEEFVKDDERRVERLSAFKSTISYMLALGITKDYEQINVYGVDMVDGTEWGPQRPDLMRFIGHASEAGIKIVLSSECALMKEGGFRYYAYDEAVKNPYARMAKEFCKRHDNYVEKFKELDRDSRQAQAMAQTYDGATQELQQLITLPEMNGATEILRERLANYEKKLQEAREENEALVSRMAHTEGARQEDEAWIKQLAYTDKGWWM